MSDKIELMRLCGVLQNNFSCLSQSESRTQPCHVRMSHECIGFTISLLNIDARNYDMHRIVTARVITFPCKFSSIFLQILMH